MAKKQVSSEVQTWLNKISQYEREFRDWQGRSEKILKRYRDDSRKSGSQQARFNILWANVQTARPAVFARLPQPDVSRRHGDNDPVGRVAALILERGLEYEINHYPYYRAALSQCVDDRFLGGRGTSWERYEPHKKKAAAIPGAPEPEEEDEGNDDGAEITEDVEEPEELDYECTATDYVHWKDFGHVVARTWEEVGAVWRKTYMGRQRLIERFGKEQGSKIPLDTKPPEQQKSGGDEESNYQAIIYEVWNKEGDEVLWISKSLGEIIERREVSTDPDLPKLEGFWPCPKPLYATLTTDSLVPVPDYALYQDQAEALDTLEDRIEGLIDALRVRGVYDASTPELSRLFQEGENGKLIAVSNWFALAEKGGIKGSVDIVDLTIIATALEMAYKAIEEQKSQIYEITGLADIIRASTDPRETLGAQKMKGQFGSMRLRDMQNAVSFFAAQILQLKAQIMCANYTDDTLMKIGAVESLQDADKQLIPQALQLLRSQPLRSFRIEVTADSMIQIDEAQEKQDRIEFLQAVSGFLQKAAQVPPSLAPLAGELLKFGVTGFRVGKTLEGIIDQSIDQLKEQAKNPQQKPDPEMVKIQAETHLAQFRAQLDAQGEQAKQQAQAQQNQQQQVLEAQRQQAEAQLDAQVEQRKAQMDAQVEAHKAALQSQMDQAQRSFDAWKAQLEASTKITVANISAKSKMDAAAIGATDQAADQAASTPSP